MRREGALGLVDADGLALLVPTAALDDRVDVAPAPAARRRLGPVRGRGAPAVPGVLPRVPRRRRDRRGGGREGSSRRPRCCCARSSVDTIRAAAAAGVRMPQKTTFFAPKPRTGMVFRTLDD